MLVAIGAIAAIIGAVKCVIGAVRIGPTSLNLTYTYARRAAAGFFIIGA